MRKEFVVKVLDLMNRDKEIIFLTGDLGFGTFEVIQDKFPDRFYNVGIAEQNMIGVACGLGLVGKKVIVYSIANFATLRVLEQIRNYLIYHNIKTLIVNGGGGFSYGQLGYTHHSVEDVSVMKSLPYMKIYAPYNHNSIEQSIESWYINNNVSYLRLEKSILDSSLGSDFLSNSTIIIGNKECDNFIITYGTIAEEAMKARQKLLEFSIDLSIIIITELIQIENKVLEMISGAKKLAFIEENIVSGGIGEHLLALCMLQNIHISKAKLFGVQDLISDTIGDQNYMRNLHNLSAQNIINFFKD
jgi:transketolase